MEKIYEEKDSNPNRGKLNFSIVLSFIVALFAIVSLVAVGFNQISYAAESTPETLTVHFGEVSGYPVYVRGVGNEGGYLHVPLLFADSVNATDTSNRSLFCIEHGIDPSEDPNAYTEVEGTYDDTGLVYILNQSSVMGGPGIITDTLNYPGTSNPLSAQDARYLEIYATQAAVWEYMYEKYPVGDTRHGKLEENKQLDNLQGLVNITVSNGVSLNTLLFSGNLYNQYIKNVVASAFSATNAKTIYSVVDSSNISLVGDDDIYQTDKIRVVANPSSDLVNYSVDISGLDGAYIVDKDGNTKTSLDTFAPSDFFYIRVPVNKVTDQNSRVQLKVVGEFQNYVGGQYYVATGSQTVVAVTTENYRVDNINYINFMAPPDTGMTVTQTIYFIGLIVLLCGVGIIYANAKPVEEK